VIGAFLKADRWPVAAGLAAALAVVGAAVRTQVVSFPLREGTVPFRLILTVACALIALTPLYSRYPELERSLVRERRTRAFRALGGIVLAWAACLPLLLGAPELDGSPTKVAWILAALLMVVGHSAVIVLGDAAWAAVLGVGVLSLIGDGGVSRPVTTVLLACPWWLAAVALAVSTALYVRYGPRP
jgi:hypothetical protein